jgi:flagellar basal body-associated protein FliL
MAQQISGKKGSKLPDEGRGKVMMDRKEINPVGIEGYPASRDNSNRGGPTDARSRGTRIRSRCFRRPFFLCGLAWFLLIFGGGDLISGPAGNRLVWASEKNFSSGGPGPMVKLTPLVINLNEASGRHYIKTTIVFEIGQKEWVEEVEKRIPSLADMVISTLCDKRLEDLKRPQSREEIKKEILARSQKTLQSPKIKQVYFDEFLFQ